MRNIQNFGHVWAKIMVFEATLKASRACPQHHGTPQNPGYDTMPRCKRAPNAMRGHSCFKMEVMENIAMTITGSD
jgi:hypothetical protein